MTGDPGKKNYKIILKAATFTNPNGDGQTTYAEKARVWADFRPLRMDERYVSNAKHSVQVGNFRIYHRDDVDPSMIITFMGSDWRITGIATVGFRDELDITAEAVS